jgi:hypothetical protein
VEIGVFNGPLWALGSTPLYSCLPPVWDTAGGDFKSPLLVVLYRDTKEKISFERFVGTTTR